MLGAHTDLTQMKRAEEDLRQRTSQLEAATKKLEKAMSEIRQLSAILPICCVCKKVRDDNGYWHQVDAYIKKHTGTDFSHGFCPECAGKVVPELEDL